MSTSFSAGGRYRIVSTLMAKLKRLDIILLDRDHPGREWLHDTAKSHNIQIATVTTHRERIVIRIV